MVRNLNDADADVPRDRQQLTLSHPAGRQARPARGERRSKTSGAVFAWLPVAQADGSNLVLDLLPYGVAAIRIAAPQVKLFVGEDLSLRGRDDRHAGPVQRALGPARAAQSRAFGRPRRAGQSGLRADRDRRKPPLAGGPLVKAALDRPRAESSRPTWPAGWSEGPTPGAGDDHDRSRKPPLGAGEPEAQLAVGPGVGRQRVVRAEHPFEPHDRGVLPGVGARDQGPRLDRGRLPGASPTSAEPR